MNYPLTLRFQAFSLSAKIEAVDALHQAICFVRKNRFKFREHVTVFSGSPPGTPLCEIKAEPSPTYPVRYAFCLPQGANLGSLIREHSGTESRYVVHDENGRPALEILPRNPRTRALDRIFSRIPLVRIFSAFLFHPALSVRDPDRQELFRFQKRAAPLENRYRLQPSGSSPGLSGKAETRLLVAVLMVVFLEG